jgi:hypothetical protein
MNNESLKTLSSSHVLSGDPLNNKLANLAHLALIAALSALKTLRKNSYEIFNKFRKTNPIFPYSSPKNNDSTKKQTQFKANSKPNEPNFGPKIRGSNPNKAI